MPVHRPQLFFTMVFSLALAACGGGGGGAGSPGDGGPSEGPSGGGARTACQQDFSPERVDNGQNCAPQYFNFCDSISETGQASFDEIPACDGVQIDYITTPEPESLSGQLRYAVLRPASGSPRAVVTTLHYRQIFRDEQTVASTHAALMRQAELVKGRNVMVIVPGAPGGNWQQTGLGDLQDDLLQGGLGDALLSDLFESDFADSPLGEQVLELGLPLSALESLVGSGGTVNDLADALEGLAPVTGSAEDFLRYIRLSRDDALARFGGASLPQFVTGLSNGAIYALRMACRFPDEVEAVMAVAGSLGVSEGEACMGNPPVGTVQVHGVNDTLSPYFGVLSFPPRGGLPPTLDFSAVEEQIAGLDLPVPGPTQTLTELLPLPGAFRDVFGPNNQCGGGIETSVLPAGIADRGEAAGDVLIERFSQCDNPQGKKSYMVTVSRGGHNWPGFDSPNENSVNLFGVVSYDFDTTLYGFDLMWRAAGLD